MSDLFIRGYLHDYFSQRIRSVLSAFEQLSEDETLSRSTDDLVSDLVEQARLEALAISSDPIDGGVAEGTIQVEDRMWGGIVNRKVFNLHAVYEFSGDDDLLYYQPQTSLAYTRIAADVRHGTLTVRAQIAAGDQVDDKAARRAFEEEIGKIRTNAGYANNDVRGHNAGLEAQIRPAVERRKSLLKQRRDLAGALGFPLKKRADAPTPVPLKRKALGVTRSTSGKPREAYRDEPALTDGHYEDAITVVTSSLLSMERSPSTVAGKDEEALRDLILVSLNGTFQGTATGETFVQKGKTDILIRVEDRHVFVAECKWWTGEKAIGAAIDQLLGYLPWRDEKAALILFIDRKDASAVLAKADTAVRGHSSFKRVGKATPDVSRRRNFVLGHPDDSEREIQLAVLFAVLPKGEAE